MTVATTNDTTGPLYGTGSATAFPFTFKAMGTDEIAVQINGAIVDASTYTVTLTDPGGTVTFTTAPADGAEVYILSDPDFDQEINLANQGPYSPEVLNEGYDRGAVRDIYLRGLLKRAPLLPVGTTAPALPAIVDSQLLGTDADGGFEWVDRATFRGAQGFPGGNVMAAGIFTEIADMVIPSGTDRIFTTGYRVAGMGGGALDRWKPPMTALPTVATGANAWWTTSLDSAQWFVSPDQHVMFDMFGAYGECVGDPTTGEVVGTPRDDLPAWLSMMDFLSYTGRFSSIFGIQLALVPVHVAPKGYYFSNTPDITIGALRLVGSSVATPNAADAGTDFYIAGGCHGIRTQTDSTDAEESGSNFDHLSGVDSFFSFINMHGQDGATPADGWRLRGRAILFYCGATNFNRHGVSDINNAVGTGALRGNGNNTHIIGGAYIRNGSQAFGGDGIHFENADSNACVTQGVQVNHNYDWGINDQSFLGNNHYGNQAASNGIVGAGARYSKRTVAPGCTYSGNHYRVVTGSETAAATETPGTGSSWQLIGTGSANTIFPMWFSGIVVRAGGPYRSKGSNSVTTFHGCYAESDQSACSGDVRTLFDNGFIGPGAIGGAFRTIVASAHSINALTVAGGLVSINGDGLGTQIRKIVHASYAPNAFTETMDSTGSISITYQGAAGNTSDVLLGPTSSFQPGSRPTAVSFFRRFPFGFYTNNVRFTSGTAAPTSGGWGRGGTIWNENAAPGSPLFWDCSAGGTAGSTATFFPVYAPLEASVTYDAPSIAANASTSTTVTVTGAVLGDFAVASFGVSTAGLIVTATVTAANTVTVVLLNVTGSAIDLASTTLRAQVLKKTT